MNHEAPHSRLLLVDRSERHHRQGMSRQGAAWRSEHVISAGFKIAIALKCEPDAPSEAMGARSRIRSSTLAGASTIIDTCATGQRWPRMTTFETLLDRRDGQVLGAGAESDNAPDGTANGAGDPRPPGHCWFDGVLDPA